MSIVDYTATGANRLKNWELMTKPALETLKYDESENFWPFHETFLNHIENMGWNDVMNYQVNNENKDLSTQFGEIPIQTIETYRVATENRPQNDAAANTLRLKFKAMYTYLFNSIDQRFKRHLTHCVETHHRMGPLAWKMITDHSVKNDNQTIRRALCSTHTLNLADFDYNVDKLITHVQENAKILTSSGETDRSIAANLFRILKAAPCTEFQSWVVQKQTSWDEGNNFDLNNFMKNAKSKYIHYVKDKMWKKSKTIEDVKKESDIVALTSKIDRLEALLARSSESNSNSQSSSSNQNNSRSGWKVTGPKQGEPWTKTVNGKQFHWCKYHNFWTTQHNSKNCRKGLKLQENASSGDNAQLEINLATTEYDLPDSLRVLFTPGVSDNTGSDIPMDSLVEDNILDDLVCSDSTHNTNTLVN